MNKHPFMLFFFIFLLTRVGIQAQTGPPGCNDYVKVEGRYFTCGGELFYPLVCPYLFQVLYNDSNNISASTIYLSRSNSYGPCNTTACDYEGADQNTCLTEISNDLSIIHQMGFNTIRTAGFGPQFGYNEKIGFSCYAGPGSMVFPIYYRYAFAGRCFPISLDDGFYDPNRVKMLSFVRKILEKANENSLKVLLDVGYDNLTSNENFVSYMVYLHFLTHYILTLPDELQKTLMGYVLVEEPTIEGQGGNTKEEVCNKTSLMYDLIKSVDPDHLVTMGGGEMYGVLEWDPGVMKMDFVCPHMYPFPFQSNNFYQVEPNSDQSVERIKGELFWLKNNSPLPWIIGETGFRAMDDQLPGQWLNPVIHYPLINGELDNQYGSEQYHQKNYAHDILKMVRDCGGAGFSWWEYQEFWWGKHENLGFLQDGYGLLRHGEVNGNTYASLKKPLVEEFENYLDENGQPPAIDPVGGQQPTSYFNPYLIGNQNISAAQLNPTEVNAVDGYVYYEGTTTGIKDALVVGSNWIKTITNPLTIYRSSPLYTFTDENGYFKLVPYNPLNSPHTITYINVSAVGTERQKDGNSWSYQQLPSSNYIFYLKNSEQMINRELTNITIGLTDAEDYTALTSIQTHGIIVAGNGTTGGSMSASARESITLFPGFTAEQGADVHLFLSPTFLECADLNGYMKAAQASAASLARSSDKTIAIKFIPDPMEFSFNIIPNPNQGAFQIKLEDGISDNIDLSFEVINLLGKSMMKGKMREDHIDIQLPSECTGVFMVRMVGEKVNRVKKVVVN